MNTDGCACSVEVDQSHFPSMFRARVVRSRKPHKCGECGEPMPKGTLHELATGLFDDEFSSHRTCIVCWRMRNDLCSCGYYFGMVHQHIRECLGDIKEDCADTVDWITGEEV
jgi:hypothetical protein